MPPIKTFDLTPDPRVLIALTHTAMSPVDALCELIDNALDSFEFGRESGGKIGHPCVSVTLPSVSEAKRGRGVLRVQDNGPGLTPDAAEKMLKAGYSSRLPHSGALGLYGVGLNIATGKFARTTILTTVREDVQDATRVTVDLQELQRVGNYKVVPERVKKPFNRGSMIELQDWWPQGNANAEVILNLLNKQKHRIKQTIGRRYSTILRGDSRVKILINGEECEPFEHCVWSDNRHVLRKGVEVPAVIRFDENLHTRKICVECKSVVPDDANQCLQCQSESMTTQDERVWGWIGIQRYDDSNHFGIDLVRNGRAIRVFEKDAFFKFTNDVGEEILDYPIDNQFGRIVGEVHLDHVPTSFTKQDFERSSAEWQRAMAYLRGKSSLQPNRSGAENNKSPVFKLFQAYRRVRRFGVGDMYMGAWSSGAEAAERISRATEKEFLRKFNQREPGYYDDAEWWKLVEDASEKPTESVRECPECSTQNPESSETCLSCGYIFNGKQCPECQKTIPVSAEECCHCGKSFRITTKHPWKCALCNHQNKAANDFCGRCKGERGSSNPISHEKLMANSTMDDDLSMPHCAIQLPDDKSSDAFKIKCYAAHMPLVASPGTNPQRLPAVIFDSFGGEKSIDVFIDKSHPVFTAMGVRPEHLIAMEAAYAIHGSAISLANSRWQREHSLSAYQAAVILEYYKDRLSQGFQKIREDVEQLFSEIRDRLSPALGEKASDAYAELDDSDELAMVQRMQESSADVSQIPEFKQSGEFVKFVPPEAVGKIFKRFPELFFDGTVWNIPYDRMAELQPTTVERIQEDAKRSYLNCLDDCVTFLKMNNPDPVIVSRTALSVRFLRKNLVDG